METITRKDVAGVIGLFALLSIVVSWIFIFIDPMVSLAASAFYYVVNK